MKLKTTKLGYIKTIILISCFITINACNNPQDKPESIPTAVETIKTEDLSDTDVETYVTCDLDQDNILDTIYYPSSNLNIVCKLSSQEFKSITSQGNLSEDLDSGVRCTKSGFEFYVDYMRAGFANQFRYDSKSKKIILIGMSRYEYGAANNDGSGNSSVNLLTNRYIGEWNYFDLGIDSLIKIPTIDIKMHLKKVSLEEYDGSSQAQFEEKCYEIYKQHSKSMSKTE